MISAEVQDHIHVYSMFSFSDGRKESGIIINKYNIAVMEVEYYFVGHQDMNAYKIAFENCDREICDHLCHKINLDEIIHIHPVSLADYKISMQRNDNNRQNLKANE